MVQHPPGQRRPGQAGGLANPDRRSRLAPDQLGGRAVEVLSGRGLGGSLEGLRCRTARDQDQQQGCGQAKQKTRTTAAGDPAGFVGGSPGRSSGSIRLMRAIISL